MKTNPVAVLVDSRRRLVLTGASLPALNPAQALRLAEDLTFAAMRAKAAARSRGVRVVKPQMAG